MFEDVPVDNLRPDGHFNTFDGICGWAAGHGYLGVQVPTFDPRMIDLKLAAALRGDFSRGLFFRGSSRLPFGQAIRPVRELIAYLLEGCLPLGVEPAAWLSAETALA